MYSLPPRFAVLAPTLRVGVSSGRSASLPHHASRYSLPRSAWACRRDAPRPCHRSDARHRWADFARHAVHHSLPRSAWECRRDAPRPCRRVGVLSRRCIRCRRTIGLSLDAERRVYTPARSVGASWGMERGRAPRPCRRSVARHREADPFGRPVSVVYDLKYVLPADAVVLRL